MDMRRHRTSEFGAMNSTHVLEMEKSAGVAQDQQQQGGEGQVQ